VNVTGISLVEEYTLVLVDITSVSLVVNIAGGCD
jgi:hypothetical protein